MHPGNSDNYRGRLFQIVSLSKTFCELCESASEFTRYELTDRTLDLLPRLYWNFFDIEANGVDLGESEYFSNYVDEEFYDSIKGLMASIMGEDDIYLDTFKEDMKYSDTPISASISEGMADIFVSLYTFVNIVKDSEGEQLEEAYIHCKEDFENYWSQTLCNLLKALNDLKYGNRYNDDEL